MRIRSSSKRRLATATFGLVAGLALLGVSALADTPTPEEDVQRSDAIIEEQAGALTNQMLELMRVDDADMSQVYELSLERHQVCEDNLVYPDLAHSEFVAEVCSSVFPDSASSEP